MYLTNLKSHSCMKLRNNIFLMRFMNFKRENKGLVYIWAMSRIGFLGHVLFFLTFLVFKMDSHPVAGWPQLTNIETIFFSCLGFLSAEITAVSHHSGLWCFSKFKYFHVILSLIKIGSAAWRTGKEAVAQHFFWDSTLSLWTFIPWGWGANLSVWFHRFPRGELW